MTCKQLTSHPTQAAMLIFASFFAVVSCQSVGKQAATACEPGAAVDVLAAGVYVRSGHSAVVFESDNIANLAFVVGNRCVAVIDTGGSVEEGRALDCAIQRLTNRPVCYVINTHVHPDHSLGNLAFDRPGVEFVGHSKLSRALALRGDIYLERASQYAGYKIDPLSIIFPERTVMDSVQLDIGGRVLTVRAHKSAHTDHDLSVIDDRTNTVFLGDLVFLEHLPVIDGSINGWIEVLRALAGESFEHVVPGHGPIDRTWPSAAEPTSQYLQQLRADVREWIASDGSLAAAQDTIDTVDSEKWTLFERYHRRNVGAAFAELEWDD